MNETQGAYDMQGRNSIHPRILGAAFEALHPAVQRFHTLRGTHELHGRVRVSVARTVPARILTRLLRLPRSTTDAPFRFTLHATPAVETWTRHFPTVTMTSRLVDGGAMLEERIAIFRLRYRCEAAGDELRLRLCAVRVLGLSLPRCMQPRVRARERGEGNRMHFDVRVALRGARLVRYQGHLDLQGG